MRTQFIGLFTLTHIDMPTSTIKLTCDASAVHGVALKPGDKCRAKVSAPLCEQLVAWGALQQQVMCEYYVKGSRSSLDIHAISYATPEHCQRMRNAR